MTLIAERDPYLLDLVRLSEVSEMDLSHLAISTWAGVAVTLETDPSMPDPATRMHLLLDSRHSAEVDSMAEAEEGVQATLASVVDL